MAEVATEALERVEIRDYDPAWPAHFAVEQAVLAELLQLSADAIEHVGSTAIPGLCAKPVIDIMACLPSFSAAEQYLPVLRERGYTLIETGMRDRLFLRRPVRDGRPMLHLHLVGEAAWGERNERLLRDYLRNHPELAKEYGVLKRALAERFAQDSLAYTRAKTDFVQGIVDAARDARGLPRVPVWED